MCSIERAQLKVSVSQWCSTSGQVGYWSGSLMDNNLSEVVTSAPISSDCRPRLKLLCSFSGSIMPRPQDGMLRYVGGETRIVSLPRDISYAELMARMRELYEGAVLLKYQQPDEDLDALVSVVNDDDLTNMIEEYDKFGSCEGFARLRIFLLPNSEQDSSFQFIDVDGRDSERRYVDALNNFSDATDFRNQQLVAPSLVDETHIAEQFLNQVGLDGGGSPNQKNFEVPMQHIQLRHLKIPHMGFGHHQQQPASHRYNDMEAPWSPVHHSPMLDHHDPRYMGDIPCSLSSVRSHTHTDLWEMTSEDYNMHNLNSQCQYEYQTQFSEAWIPSGFVSAGKAGYCGNLHHGFDAYQGNNVHEPFQMSYPQNQGYLDFHRKHVAQVEQKVENEVHNRETYFQNTAPTIHHGCPSKEHTELRSLYESPHQDSGCTLPPYVRIENDECKGSFSSENTLPQHGNLCDCQPLSSNYIHIDDTRYVPVALDLGNDLYHGHVDHHMHRFGNFPYATNDASQPSYLIGHPQRFSASFQNSAHSKFGASMSMLQNNDSAFLKNTMGCSPRFQQFEENQGPLYSSPRGLVRDGFVVSDHICNHSLKINPDAVDMSHICMSGIDRPRSEDDLKYADNIGPIMDSSPSLTLADNKIISSSFCSGMSGPRSDAAVTERAAVFGEIKETKQVEASEGISIADDCGSRRDVNKRHVVLSECENATQLQSLGIYGFGCSMHQPNSCYPIENAKVSDDPLSCLSNKVAAVDSVGLGKTEKVNSGAFENAGAICSQWPVNLRAASGLLGSQAYSENDNMESSKIELTEAEEEAIARGLQTIKNDDLEEIKELGSGTYGAVYHGKWKGSDVAIKRIKASCFAGRPSERERLIADFWKEALILSSLHHPNVVSFYGIVRDGPDGSLATVTEFMINGSLKQFLQKKDRTIDRRKRLIIAMDTAFGMEYLHGKNIVHFDLKCENLLVNMRDPHRPVCKIGDLGLSKVKQHTLVSGGVRGTLPWMAPELLSGKNNMVTEKIDVYSFGIVMWELLTGEEPYADMHCATMIGRIVNDMLRPEIPTWCDPEWRALMESCWASDPVERPPFSEISQKLRAMAAAINLK